jgi:thiol-disulfide isomerase/thioredoxin
MTPAAGGTKPPRQSQRRSRRYRIVVQSTLLLLLLLQCYSIVQAFNTGHMMTQEQSRRPTFVETTHGGPIRSSSSYTRRLVGRRRRDKVSMLMSGKENSSDHEEAEKKAAPLLFQDDEVSKPPSFGESVSIRSRPGKKAASTGTPPAGTLFQTQEKADNVVVPGSTSNNSHGSSAAAAVETRSESRIAADNLLRRNKFVALAAIGLAILSWGWQVLHPIPPIQLLADMEKRSADISVVGRNGKPTVVDFWAPWCENCKLSAATMHALETEYADRINFIVVNGDDMVRNGQLVEAFRVDAIPHVALVEADGTVDTALIGPIPKRILRANLDVLIENSNKDVPDALPYQMLDVFENRPPQDRRVIF